MSFAREKRAALAAAATLTVIFLFPVPGAAAPPAETRLSPQAIRQIEALLTEKALRTPAQRKVDSALLRAVREGRGERVGPGVSAAGLVDASGRFALHVKATVTDGLLARLEALGARDVAAFPAAGELTATLEPRHIEALAAMPEVRFVRTRDDGDAAAAYGTPTSQGDRTHAALAARQQFGHDGTGVRIGVISDSVDFLARSQLSGNLGPVTVVPGQSGGARAGEGTAMLEIIHDVAPGAQLFFATGTGDQPNMASNIEILRSPPYSCDIIVDDWFYELEPPFQDGPIAQAVNAATAAGVVYVTAAQNDGNLTSGASGTWEGDFADGGTLAAVGAGNVHTFGPGVGNPVTQSSGYHYALFWSDPLGASSNDYDLFVLDATLTNVLASSTNDQTGTQDPAERILSRTVTAGDRIVVLKNTGAASRFLHVKAFRGRLEYATAGAIKGHAAAADAVSTAATNAETFYPGPFTSAALVEPFSSDGYRRVFYQPNGTAITPGNVSSTGGLVRQKPDLTAADGISTTVPAFTSYFGTSAAASHAAAIAALVMSASPGATATQVKATLASTAIDIMAPGFDRDSGAGVVMAQAALASLSPTPVANVAIAGFTLTEAPGANGNSGVEPGETGRLVVTLRNGGAVNATGVTASLALATPVAGVTVTAGGPFAVGGGTLAPAASASNAQPFTIAFGPSVPCGQELDLVLTVTYGGGAAGASPLPVGFRVRFGSPTLRVPGTLDTTAPSATARFTAASGTQTGRLNADLRSASCDNPKSSPGLATASGSRRYDAYTFTNDSDAARCVSVNLVSACNAAFGTQLYLAAYDAAGFDPANPASHYLADSGATALGDQTMSFEVAAGVSYTLVVSEVNPGASAGCAYTLEVDGLPCADLAGPHGDADGNGSVAVGDVFFLINHLFAGGAPPLGFADANGDGVSTVADVFYLINHLFAGGPAPV